jgi:hypothetical protein
MLMTGARNCRDRDATALERGTGHSSNWVCTPALCTCWQHRPVRFLTGTEAPVPSPSLACKGNAEDCTEGLQCERRVGPEVKRQRTIGPPVPVKLLIEDVMYDLNREVAEKLKTSSVFSTTSSPSRSHDGEHACCRETMRQTDPPSDADNDIFSDVLSLADQLGCRRRLPR